MNEYHPICVPPDKVETVLPIVAPLIARAARKAGDWSEQQITNGLKEGNLLLWLAVTGTIIKAIVVTRLIYSEKTGRICEIVLCAGSGLNDWVILMKRMEQFASEEGCSLIRLSGRKGWLRVFKEWKQPYVTLEKAIN